MWEENRESIRVRRRHFNDAEQGDSDGETETENSPLLPDGTQQVATAASVGEGTGLRQRTESLTLDEPDLPMKMVLSTWGVAFSPPDSTPQSLNVSEPCFYALLSLEETCFAGKAGQVAERFGTSTTNQKTGFEMKWNRPDMKILYRFNSLSDYGGVVRDIKEGKLRDVKVKGQAYRAVKLEPVRVIDSTLKCFLQMTFPLSVREAIKSSLQPLLKTVDVAKRFIFIPSLEHHQQLTVTEATDSAHNHQAPPIVITLITSQPETSTARKISDIIHSSQNWVKYEFRCDPNPFKNQEVYQHREYASSLPLISVTAGSGGWGMDDGIRVTLLCREKYDLMVEFYSIVLSSPHPPKTEDHAIFSLMDSPTSVLELVIQRCTAASGVSPSVSGSTHLHFIVDKLTMTAVKLCRRFPDCELTDAGCCEGEWLAKDPQGNMVVLHDRAQMETAM